MGGDIPGVSKTSINAAAEEAMSEPKETKQSSAVTGGLANQQRSVDILPAVARESRATGRFSSSEEKSPTDTVPAHDLKVADDHARGQRSHTAESREPEPSQDQIGNMPAEEAGGTVRANWEGDWKGRERWSGGLPPRLSSFAQPPTGNMPAEEAGGTVRANWEGDWKGRERWLGGLPPHPSNFAKPPSDTGGIGPHHTNPSLRTKSRPTRIEPNATFSEVMDYKEWAPDKALKSDSNRPLYQAFSLLPEADKKRRGVEFIKASLDRQYGKGFAKRVFDDAKTRREFLGSIQPRDGGLDYVIKGRDLPLIEETAQEIWIKDKVSTIDTDLKNPANNITSVQIKDLVEIHQNPRTRAETKNKVVKILHRTLSKINELDRMRQTLTGDETKITATQVLKLESMRFDNGDVAFSPAQVKMMNAAVLRAQLPAGAILQDNGAITGKTIFDGQSKLNSFCDKCIKGLNINNPTYVDIMQHIGQAQLDKKSNLLGNGLAVCPQSVKDLYRMNITIGDYSSIAVRDKAKKELSSSKIESHVRESVAEKLFELTGENKAALLVLTSLMNQIFASPFVRGVYKEDGTLMEARVAAHHFGQVPVGTADGPQLRDAGGIGAGSIRIDRSENSDYRVSIEHPFIMTQATIGDDGDAFAGLGGTGIQGVGRVSYFVDSSEAAQGNLKVIDDGPATITWEGHMSQ